MRGAEHNGTREYQTTVIPPATYLTILVCVALATYGFRLTTQGIFACPGDGYDVGVYLADCNASAYGDFDHGAFWYQLKSVNMNRIREADVLLVGNSRLQFGFSTPETAGWFDEIAAQPYLLGFSHSENSLFVGPLLDRIVPNPKALVINADSFFKQRITPPVEAIFAGGDTLVRYQAKQRWQPIHRYLCGHLSFPCGDAFAIYRDTTTGFWKHYGVLPGATPGAMGLAPPRDSESWPDNLKLARDFLERFNLPAHCVLLTVVPSSETPLEEAKWLAEQLELELIAPILPELQTFDGSHLDIHSAERWSKAFFEQAAPVLSSCLKSAAGIAEVST